MKKLLVLYITFFTTWAFASPELMNFMQGSQAQTYCEESYQQEHGRLEILETNSKQVVYVFRNHMTSKVVIIDLQTWKERLLFFEDKITDLELAEDKIFVLTKDKFISINLHDFSLDFEFRTLPENMKYKRHSYATGFSLDETNIYIAHGEYGVVKTSRKNFSDKMILNPAVPQSSSSQRSMITDIVGNKLNLFFVYDNITSGSKSKAFEGMVIWDKLNDQVEKIVPLNQKKEGYYLPKIKITSTQIIMQNLYLIFKYDLNKIKKNRYLKASQRIWSVENGKLTHRAMILDDLIAGCIKDNSTFKTSSIAVSR